MIGRSCRPFETNLAFAEQYRASLEFSQGDYQGALCRCEQFLLSAPSEAWSWRLKAECLFSLERYEAAADSFEKAIQLGGAGTRDTFLWLAMALHRAGDTEAAIDTLRGFLAGTAPETHHLVDQARTTLAHMQAC